MPSKRWSDWTFDLFLTCNILCFVVQARSLKKRLQKDT
jgi:hypothetical protein